MVMTASDSAAARNTSSLISRAPASTAAWPSAGNTYALFACAGYRVDPSCVIGSNGDPDANATFPFVNRTASSNVHSALCVGLDNGKITGRSLSSAIFRNTVSSNAPAIVETPINAVGFRVSIASSNVRFGSTP